MRILIVEDDFTSHVVPAAVLQKNGYDVTETVNGTEAWGQLQQPDPPRLTVLHRMMPGMD